MDVVKIVNVTRGSTVAASTEVARSLFTRGRGLLGRKGLPKGGGLLIVPCNSIHSFFMQFPFDAVFLTRDLHVIHVIHEMQPWRVSPLVRRAHAVLELPPGAARAAGLEIGDRLELHP